MVKYRFDRIRAAGSRSLERVLTKSLSLLPKKPVSLEFGLWKRYSGLLPEGMRRRLKEARKRAIVPGRSLPPEAVLPAGDEVDGARARRAALHRDYDDGMRDYPNTRPCLSMDYLAGLIRWLAKSDYNVMSYRDLAGPLQLHKELMEFTAWIDRASQRDEKAVLLQYDVDARPDVTAEILKTHIEYGVPANAMIFRRKIFDWKLKREGIVEYDEYELDYETLKAFERMGGVIGYHCNAFDQSGGDDERAIEIFLEDVEELRKHFTIDYFSMHGGHVTPEGKCNATIPIEPYLEELGLTWVHNGHSAMFHSNWADGGASNPLYRKECNDLLDFLLATNPGERCRLLFHPQYYNDESNSRFDFPVIQDARWTRETRRCAEVSGLDGEQYWSDRVALARDEIIEYNDLFEARQEERPVFVNGMSRSGTTLLVSMFDAHPDGAMAYESYPRYLHTPSDDGVLTMEEFTYAYQVLLNYDEGTAFELLNRPPLRNLQKFAAVTSWTGMTTQQTGSLLRSYLTRHHRITCPIEALKIVAATARFKLRNQGAAFWGTKCQGNFADYVALWPESRFVYIVRNGLDILASQMTNGAFNPDPAKLGKQWVRHLEQFERFQAANPVCNMTKVVYDRLVRDPESETRSMCEALEFEFHPGMIQQHKGKSTLAENPRGQLSAERVQQPIDTSSIGRWKEVLSESDVEQFLAGCGGSEQFLAHGFDWRR